MGDAAAHLLGTADIGSDGQRMAAFAFDLRCDVEDAGFVEIDQRHAGAFGSEQTGGSRADARRGSRHDDNAML